MIHPLLAFKDNYIWVIHAQDKKVIVVDPGEAAPVLHYLKTHQLDLRGILLTHHHRDHSGGIASLKKAYPSIAIYSSFIDKVPGVTHYVKQGDKITFQGLKHCIEVLAIPGHTLGHLAFLYGDCLFSGDTLFSVGAGKIFEGTPEQMYTSLNTLKRLPKSTLLYCGHEYTLANIAFAECVEPNNQALQERKVQVQALQLQNIPSLPISLESEINTNPFLRFELPHVLKAIQAQSTPLLNHPVEALKALRAWKDRFKTL